MTVRELIQNLLLKSGSLDDFVYNSEEGMFVIDAVTNSITFIININKFERDENGRLHI